MKKNNAFVYSLPITFWLTILFTFPTLIVIVYSFLKKGLYGGVEWNFSINAYKSLFTSYFFKIVSSTLIISVWTTIITIIFAIPTALYIAKSKKKSLLLFLVIIPFWTNFLIRIYAWISILGNNGFINNMILYIKNFAVIHSNSTTLFSPILKLVANMLQGAPYQFLYNKTAVVLVSIYAYLPYAILPLYSTIEKFDFNLIEAARDLGAGKVDAYRKIFLPSIKPGIITAGLFTFIPALGSYAIPQLVGGKNSYMLGNVIAKELTLTRNWPKAAAISTILIIVTTIIIIIFSKYDKEHQVK